VAGEIDKISGYVIDAKILKTIIFDKILSKVDHRNLNVDVEFLKGINPTSENLIVAFWKELKPEINTDTRKLYKIKLYETENNIAEYYGN